MKKAKLLIDVAVLAQGIKTGIYRVTDEVVRRLLSDGSVEVLFTLSEEAFFLGHGVNLREGLKKYCRESGVKARFIECDGDPAFSDVDVYVSTFFKVPENWAAEEQVKKVVFAYDLIPLMHPEYCEEIVVKIVKEFYDQIGTDWLIFAISESTKKDLLRFRPDISPENIVVLYLGADLKFSQNIDKTDIERVKKQYSIPVESAYVLSVATLEVRKNLISVLEGFGKYVRASGDRSTCLVLSGMKGWKLDQLNSEISRRPELVGRVILTGFVDDNDLPVLYAGATVFVYMSFYEGFGLPPLEAMCCGVPVITSNTSSLPEVVGDSGIMLSPRDTDGLAGALNEFIHDPIMHREYSKRAKERSREFSWDGCAKVFLASIGRATLVRDPCLTVITICYNEEHIRDTCQSLAEQLFRRFEWIVIDGGSDRKTLDVLDEYSHYIDHMVSEKDDGRYDAMNKGISLARGKYLLFLNGGDYLYDKYVLSRIFQYSVPVYLIDLFRLVLNAGVIYGEVVSKETGLMPFPLWRTGPQDHGIEFFSGSSLPHQATFIKKDLFGSIGPYNAKLKYAGDYEWFMRSMILNGAKSQYLPMVVSVYNFDGVSSSSIDAEAPHIVEARNIYNHYASVASGVANRPFGWEDATASNDVEPNLKLAVSCHEIGESRSDSMVIDGEDMRLGPLADKVAIDHADRMINLAIPRLSGNEPDKVLQIVNAYFNPMYSGGLGSDLSMEMRSEDRSIAFKSLMLHLNRLGRSMGGSEFPVRRAEGVKGLLRLREKLLAYYSMRDFSPIIQASGDPGMGVEGVIRSAYFRLLGRAPGEKEIAGWVQHVNNGMPIDEFVSLVEHCDEAREYVRGRAELKEFAAGLDPLGVIPVGRDRYSTVQNALRKVARCRKFDRGMKGGV